MTTVERVQATQKVIDRFRDKPFSWSGANCIRLARAQAKALGADPPPVPMVKSARGALLALKRRGFNSIAELLDAHFTRLPAPALAMPGDLVTCPSDDALEAVCINVGSKVVGWHGQDLSGLKNIDIPGGEFSGAWRIGVITRVKRDAPPKGWRSE